MFICVHLWFILFGFAPVATAQSKWTLTTADFQSRQIDLAAIDDAGVHAAAAGDRPAQVVAWGDVLSLDRALDFSAAGKYVVWLTDGDHLRGEPGKIEGEALVFNASSIGMMNIPLRQIAAITRSTQTAPRDRQGEDVVVLANGDTAARHRLRVRRQAAQRAGQRDGDACAV